MSSSSPAHSDHRVRPGFVTVVTISFALLTAGWLIQYTEFKYVLIGTTSERVVRNAFCPVLVVRQPMDT